MSHSLGMRMGAGVGSVTMASKLRLRVFVVFSALTSAAGCGQVADLGNNGSGGAGAEASAGSTGGTIASNTGGETGGREPATGGVMDTGGARPVPPDDACVAGVLTRNACTACHSVAAAVAIGAGLVLEGSNLGARLSATQATYKGVTLNAASCVAGSLIVDPVSPADSILLRKVTGTQACGDNMPPGTGLSGADLSCIQNWINKF